MNIQRATVDKFVPCRAQRNGEARELRHVSETGRFKAFFMPVTNENVAYISSTSLRTRLCCLLLWVSHNLLCAFKARLHIAFFVAQPNAIIVSHQVSNRFDTSAVDSSNKIAWKLPAVYTRSLEVVTQSTTKTALSCPAKIACVNGLLDHARFAIEIGLKEIILI